MKYLEKLLEGIEVEWKTLGEILNRTKGTSITAGQMKNIHKKNAPLKIFAGGKTTAFVEYNEIPEKDINREPSIIVKSRGVIEFEYYDKPFTHKNEMWSYHSTNKNIDIKFVYYFLKINEPYFQNIGNRMQMPQISIPHTENFKIPIPPLSVQKEIVRILDVFSELTAELTAELKNRKKQYNYYRDQLLSFEGKDVEWKPLEDVAEFTNGKGHEKDIVENGKYIVVNSKFISTNGIIIKYSDKQICPLSCDDILIVMSDLPNGKALAKTFFVEENDKYTLNQRIGGIRVKNSKALFPRFLNYLLNRTPQLLKFDDGASQTNLRKDQILNIKIPIPSLEEQIRIASILDKFDTLTTSISEGLPKEIELRKKQYEYYRDMLLTFPKKENV